MDKISKKDVYQESLNKAIRKEAEIDIEIAVGEMLLKESPEGEKLVIAREELKNGAFKEITVGEFLKDKYEKLTGIKKRVGVIKSLL